MDTSPTGRHLSRCRDGCGCDRKKGWIDIRGGDGYIETPGKWGNATDFFDVFFIHAPDGVTEEKEKGMTTIKIKGMSCGHCVMAVTKALGGIDGIKDVQVDLEKGEAAFTEEKPIDRALIRERIVKAGFDVAG